MVSKERPRIESIQVIRVIAFILIFLSHVELIATGPIGVSLFLVLSGFCMTYAYLDRPEKTPSPGFVTNLKFVWGKVKKLYPLHVVTLIFVALVIFGDLVLHRASGSEIAEQGGYFVANAFLLQSWIPWRDGYFSFNAVSWYLSTSVFSYFIFLWVFRAIQSKDKKRIARLAGITLASMILMAVILGIGQQNFGWTKDIVKWVVYICPFYRAGDFIVGLVAGYIFVSTQKSLDGGVIHTVIQLIVIAVMTVQVLIYCSGNTATNWTLTLFWLPTSVLCIYLFAVNKGMVSKTLSKSKALVWVGNISGEAFLIHQICIKAAEYLTKNKWIVAIIAFTATLLAAVVWRLVYKKVQTKVLSKRRNF